jgi:PqqD family protein of HPr-rel-A system
MLPDDDTRSLKDACYSADPAEGRKTVVLDVLSAIYHVRSGTTHMLAEPAPTLLDMLGRESLTLDALLQKLAAEFEIGPLEDARPALAARLAELESAGLVWRA